MVGPGDLNLTASMPVWWQIDNSMGILFFILGVAGAGIMVYVAGVDKLLIGNRDKIMLDREKEIAQEKLEIEKLRAKCDKDDNDEANKRCELLKVTEDRLERERGYQRKLGLLLYLFIGGIISAVFATGIVQAVTYGAGWTAFVGLFGIKNDAEERNSIKDTSVLELSKEYETKIRELQNQSNPSQEKLLEEYKVGFAEGRDATLEQIKKH